MSLVSGLMRSLYKGIAIQLGHQDIGDDQRRLLLLEHLQRFLPVAGSQDRIALEAQGDFEQLQNIGNVFNN